MSFRPRLARARFGVAAMLAGLALSAYAAQPAPGAVSPTASSRGELLYLTHCIECHNEQIHWRDRKAARDWRTLRAQVDRWQQAARLAWSAEDVEAVTHHLNDTIYRFAAPHKEALRARD
jgi:mono/diheme cytochrome c family protein